LIAKDGWVSLHPRPGNVSGPCSKLCYMTECGVHDLMSLYLVKEGVAQWGACPTYVTQQEKG
jgi:hypothetical protein